MHLRDAALPERHILEGLQLRASIALPAYRLDILAHPDAIELSPALIREGRVRVAEDEGRVIGFSVLLRPAHRAAELDGLFVDPPRWRRGVGKALLLDAVSRARAESAVEIDVTANPGAAEFYLKCGFAVIGEAQTRFGQAARMRYVIAQNVAASDNDEEPSRD